MDGKNLLTIILPLLGKEEYTKIWLDHNLYADFKYIIIDGSKTRMNENFVKDKIKKSKFNIKYIKYENEKNVSDWVKKMATAASKSDTKYTMTVDNDDFINVIGIKKCIEKLEKSNFQIASGNVHYVSEFNNKYKLLKNTMKFSAYKNVQNINSIKNYLNHNKFGNGYVWYSIYKTNIFYKVWEHIHKSNISDVYIVEYLNTQLSFCFGKFISVNTCHYIRITNPKAKSTSMHMINENHLKKNILFNIKENKKIIDMYKYVCNFIENKDALKNIYIDYFTPMKVNSNLNTFPELIKFSIKNLFSIVINKLVFLIPKLNIKFVRIILSNLYLFNFIYSK